MLYRILYYIFPKNTHFIWAGEKFMKLDGLLWPLFYTGVFYLIFCGILTVLFNRLEKKLDYYKG